VYLGGAYFFFRTVRSSQWHTVAGGFLYVGTFASMMGITTILHWDRFIHSNVAFWLWVALYFTTPFVVFAVFFRNQREYARSSDGEFENFAGPGAARERRWSAARILLQVEGIMLFLILVAGVRAHNQFDPSNALTWMFAAGFVATALATAILYIRMESRASR
jgi:hypothetical protein